jgi:hypothetical protein
MVHYIASFPTFFDMVHYIASFPPKYVFATPGTYPGLYIDYVEG